MQGWESEWYWVGISFKWKYKIKCICWSSFDWIKQYRTPISFFVLNIDWILLSDVQDLIRWISRIFWHESFAFLQRLLWDSQKDLFIEKRFVLFFYFLLISRSKITHNGFWLNHRHFHNLLGKKSENEDIEIFLLGVGVKRENW